MSEDLHEIIKLWKERCNILEKKFETLKEERDNETWLLKQEIHALEKAKELDFYWIEKDKRIIDKLFKYIERSFFKGRFLFKLVELCGQLKMPETLPYLKKVFLKQPLFNTQKTDELRVASAVSLRQIGTPEAMELIKKGLNDKRGPVRRTCNIIMELKRNEKEKPPKEEG